MTGETPSDKEGSPESDKSRDRLFDFWQTARFLAAEIKGQSDRGAALIAVAFVDDAITEYMKSRMLIVKGKGSRGSGRGNPDIASLFHHMGALGSFGARIKVSYAMRMISERFYLDLDDIRDIRNQFAHLSIARLCPETPLP